MGKVRKPKTISRTSVVDQVCDSIKQSILDHVWNVGDKLPSESEFAETFGVNRLSVRMALQKLSTLGMIETKIGEGSYVADFSLKPYFIEIAGLFKDQKRRKDVEQLRNLLEGECMQLAIIYSNEDDLAKLKAVLDNYLEVTKRYCENVDDMDILDELVDSDLAFHKEIIKMSHNQLYEAVYQMVEQLIRDHIKHLLYARLARRKERGIPVNMGEEDTHIKMYNSIKNGDVEAAKKAREQTIGIVPVHGADYFDEIETELPEAN